MSTTDLERQFTEARDTFQSFYETSITSQTAIETFIRDLKHRIEAQPHLKPLFTERATKFNNDIFAYYRDHDNLRKARGTMGTYTAFYMNRKT
jgi:hypothetical protein